MSSGEPFLNSQYPFRLKNILFVSVLILLSPACLAQISFISGIVNKYYHAVEVLPSKACVRVTNPAGLAHNDKVMVIQMKGASINTSVSSSFGDTSSLNNAGNYEIATVCDIRGDSVFLVYMLLNQYTVAGKVQLVRIPQYYSATVTDTLKAAPWNNTTGTGGVLAISVEEDLVLNEHIYADSSGFRGGNYKGNGTGCGNSPGSDLYAYDGSAGTQDGAYKGEGVTDLAIGISGGRGAPANGGGGGNNHNNGGAGGANLSMGGDGGGNSSAIGCYRSYPGEGGKALSNYGGIKIFSGGGGGAGHTNNGTAASKGGGHGGGIIFIETKNLTGNGYSISANGQMGNPAASDGASGGGAGGTIILKATTYTGTTTIEANGGTGGTEDDGINIKRCYGSGGGGSGGVIYFSGAVPALPVTTAAGNAGLEFNRDPNCSAIVLSTAGVIGQLIPNYTYRRSMILVNGYCAILLPVGLVYFNARYTNGQTQLRWKLAQPGIHTKIIIERNTGGSLWKALQEQQAVENKYNYEEFDASPVSGLNLYRLRIESENEPVVYSAIQRIFVPVKQELFSIYPNPTQHEVTITGDLSNGKELVLFDLSGRLIWKKNIEGSQSNLELKLPTLAPGVYLVKLGEAVKRLTIF